VDEGGTAAGSAQTVNKAYRPIIPLFATLRSSALISDFCHRSKSIWHFDGEEVNIELGLY
jgi:hypothetical protein